MDRCRMFTASRLKLLSIIDESKSSPEALCLNNILSIRPDLDNFVQSRRFFNR